MITYHWNTEYWYRLDASLLRRASRWLIWIGGWELANFGGWRIRGAPSPVSILGHRVTWFSWGFQVRLRGGYLVWSRREGTLYFSPSGTPDGATVWIKGTPTDVVESAAKR
jgi:hypothetical protein